MNYLQKFYEQAFHWLITVGPKILIAIVVLIAGQWMLRYFNRWLKRLMDARKLNPSVRTFLANLLAVILQVLLIMVLMQILGIGMTLFATLIAGFSVAAGLALSGTLQNFASGVLILLLRPYKVGDNVVTQNQEGTVSSIQLFYTVILTFDNKTVIVPNSKLSNEIILNLSRQGKRRLDIELKFKYTIDFEKIKGLISRCFSTLDYVLEDPALRIGISKLDTDTYTIIINAWSPAHGFEDSRLLINEKLMAELKNAGIIGSA
ncbi:MAG: mechanosensitive ion channel family protein [Chitinophagaceae bacterium]